MPISRPRALLRLVLYAALTLPLMPVQALLVLARAPMAARLPRWYHAACCRILGFRVLVRGVPSEVAPTLFVSNHLSYLDIVVLSACLLYTS